MSWKMQGEIKGSGDSGDSGYCDLLTSKVTTASSSGSSDAKRERNADKNKGSGDSGYCDLLTSEVPTASSSRSFDTKHARNAVLCKRIADKKFVIAAAVVVVFIIIIISLAVPGKKTETYLPCPLLESQNVACPDSWIGYRGKCFYTSNEERNWSLSLKTCSSFNASLAVIDTQKELDFWVEIFRPFHYWFDLSREVNQTWKWSNGTQFKNQFLVRGEGFCAYINGKGADSTVCSLEKLFLCSRPESCRITG
ncbi:C-type lectin domain family 2 member D-like isoform X2 [Pantherophis guttatus]|nr:C-type lectin domain family 2 member D-like isoform X2 [Pantherophis guttatus]